MTSALQTIVRSGLSRAELEAIGAVAERLVAATRALAVYLHGDRARGEARDDDPWELLVVLPADVVPGRWTPLTLWPLVADAPMSVGVRAVTATTFEADRDDPNAVSADASREGLRLYARHPNLRLDATEAEIEAEAVTICRHASMRERAARADVDAALRVLDKVPDVPPDPGDELASDA